MATDPKYTKKTLKSLLDIFTANEDEMLAAYYAGASGEVQREAERKLKNIISTIERMIDNYSTIDKDEETRNLNALIQDFVNGSPVINDSVKSIETKGNRYTESAKDLISFSQSLVSNVMRFSAGSGRADQAQIILKPYQDKINAYNVLLQHKINGTLENASEKDIAIMAKGFYPDNPKIKSKDFLPGLINKPLNEIVDEYGDYLNNTVVKDENVIAIAKMQTLDKAGHTPDVHRRNILGIAIGAVLAVVLTLSGAPLDNTSMEAVLRYLGETSSIALGAGAFLTSIIATAVTLPKAIAAKKTNKKMLNLNLNQMKRVYQLIKENQSTKDKKKKSCIADINKKLKEEKIPIKLSSRDYDILNDVEKRISGNPLTVSKASKKQDKRTRKAMKKAHETDPIKYRGIAEDILSPLYGKVTELGEGRSKASIDNLMEILNPNGIFVPDATPKSTTKVETTTKVEPKKSNPRTKSPKPKVKVEVEEMSGYNDVVDGLQDSSENNTTYDLKTKKNIFQKNSLEFSITINKTKIQLTEQEALSIMELVEKKINKENFKGGPITHEETGTVIEVSNISRGKPKKPASPGNPRGKK